MKKTLLIATTSAVALLFSGCGTAHLQVGDNQSKYIKSMEKYGSSENNAIIHNAMINNKSTYNVAQNENCFVNEYRRWAYGEYYHDCYNTRNETYLLHSNQGIYVHARGQKALELYSDENYVEFLNKFTNSFDVYFEESSKLYDQVKQAYSNVQQERDKKIALVQKQIDNPYSFVDLKKYTEKLKSNVIVFGQLPIISSAKLFQDLGRNALNQVPEQFHINARLNQSTVYIDNLAFSMEINNQSKPYHTYPSQIKATINSVSYRFAPESFSANDENILLTYTRDANSNKNGNLTFQNKSKDYIEIKEITMNNAGSLQTMKDDKLKNISPQSSVTIPVSGDGYTPINSLQSKDFSFAVQYKKNDKTITLFKKDVVAVKI